MKECIIVDVDWTLAQKWDRDIYDDSKLYLDTVIEPVKYFVNKYPEKIFIVSWRSDSCKEQTIAWLEDNWVMFNEIYMRKEWDNRCDTIIKREIYEEFIKGKYNVFAVFEDRKRVKRMWVEEWLFVFDVNQYDLEF